MKIVYKIIKTGSGNDVYFKVLAGGMEKLGVQTEIQYYHKLFQYFPFLLVFFNKKSDADVVHSNIEYAWALKENGKPLVSTVHHLVFDKDFQKHTSLFQKIFHYFVLWPSTYLSVVFSNKIVAISKSTKKTLINTFPNSKNVVVIYCAVDTNVFRPRNVVKHSSDGKHHLIFVGNLIKRKGADLLPLIMNKLGNNYVLHYTSGLKSKDPSNFSLSNMIPLGQLTLDQLVSEYNKCDALLFPSRLEGFGYAVAEAMACNIDVIASNNSSIPEITGRQNGTLCRTNDVDNFVVNIHKIFLNISKNKQSRARIIKLFSIQNMMNIYKNFYENI